MRSQLMILLFYLLISLTEQYEYLERSLFISDNISKNEQNLFNRINNVYKENEYKEKTYKCGDTTISEYSKKQIIGILDQNNEYRLEINDIKHHWKIQIRCDFLLLKTVDEDDKLIIIIGSKKDPSPFQKKYHKRSDIGTDVCNVNSNDVLVQLSNTFNEPKDNIELQIKSNLDQDYSDEGFGIKNLYVYIDICHPSCKTCSGPSNKECISCDKTASYNKDDKTCGKCSSGIYQFGNCVQDCETGFFQDEQNGICIQEVKNCKHYNLKQICDECENNSYFIDGFCVTKNFDDYEQISVNENKKLIFKGLLSDNFGEIEIQNLGLIPNSFFSNNYYQTDAKVYTTTCNNIPLLGGAYISSSAASISKTFNQIKSHWQIEVNFILFQIDNWKDKKLILEIDDKQTDFKTKTLVQDKQLCGRSNFNDNVVQISSIFAHQSDSFNLKISTDLEEQLAYQQSFGIRELYIIVTYCQSKCKQCDEKGCTQCQPNLYKNQYDCLESCPRGTYTIKFECGVCKAECDVCSDGQSCSSCKDTYLLISDTNQCVQQCPDNYYVENKKYCKKCNLECQNCSGKSNTECISCSDGKFLQKSTGQCVLACELHQFADVKSRECIQCNSNCKSCSGPKDNDCIACESELFIDKLQNKCLTQCPSSSIISFEDKTCSDKCLQVIQGNICQQTCSIGFYSEKNIQDSKLNNDSNINTLNDNKKIYCKQCSDKCSECQLSADDCTVCKDEDTLSCFLSEERKIEYLESKLCKSIDELDKDNCKQIINESESLSVISNFLGLSSMLIMLLSALSSYSFIGFIGVYNLQLLQQIGNYCLLNIDYLFAVKEIGLKYTLTNNIFNMIPIQLLFKKNEKLKDLYGPKLFSSLMEIYPITNNIIHNFFYQGCLMCGLYLLCTVFFIFVRKSKIYLFTRFNLIIKFWMICSNMLLIGLTRSDIFTEDIDNQYLQTTWYLVFSNVYIGQMVINIYQTTSLKFYYNQQNQSSQYWQMYSNLNLQLKNRFFWLLFELRKIIVVFSISFAKDSIISIWINLSLNGLFFIFILVLQPIKTKTRNFLILFIELIYSALIIEIYLSNTKSMPKIFVYSLASFQIICVKISLTYGMKTFIQKYKKYQAEQKKLVSAHLLSDQDLQIELSAITAKLPTKGNKQDFIQSIFSQKSPETRFSKRTDLSTQRESKKI